MSSLAKTKVDAMEDIINSDTDGADGRDKRMEHGRRILRLSGILSSTYGKRQHLGETRSDTGGQRKE